jgi:hypothetical protein
LNFFKCFVFIEGVHSPDAVKKLLSLSENGSNKGKVIKNSSSSTSVPLSAHINGVTVSNSNISLSNSVSASSTSSNHFKNNTNGTHRLSVTNLTNHKSHNSNNKTIKMTPSPIIAKVKINGTPSSAAVIALNSNNSNNTQLSSERERESDSGRDSMTSNVEQHLHQDLHSSPTLNNTRAYILNRCK